MQSAPESSGYVSELVSEYESALQELTFNSKPLINNLTIIAGENMHAAEHVVGLVEKRLFHAPADQKLPSIYLLDSIVKNIGGVYHEMFQRNIVSIFRTTYDAVDEPTRASMRRLLGTWATIWPRKAQLIQDRLPPAPAEGAPPPPLAQGAPSGRGIHINPAYLAKLQGLDQSDRRTGSRRSPPPPRHSISPPPSSSSSYRHDRSTRSPPRKRGRSPPRGYGSGGSSSSGSSGAAFKAARRSPPDRITEILSGQGPSPGRDHDRHHREQNGRGGYRPRQSEHQGGGGRYAQPPRHGGQQDPRTVGRPGSDRSRDVRSVASAPHGGRRHDSMQASTSGGGDYNPMLAAGYGPPPPAHVPQMVTSAPSAQMGGPPASSQPVVPPMIAGGGGHQAILAEAQLLMQQLEQRLQTQLGQPDADHGEVMRQLGQLRALQQQANQILVQPSQPAAMAAPPAGLAPNLVQNVQGLGQGQQARESILSILQGALASSFPPAQQPGFPSSYAPMGVISPPPSSGTPVAPMMPPAMPGMQLPTEDLLHNLMNLGMIGGAPPAMQGSQGPTSMDQLAGGYPPPMPGMPPGMPQMGMPGMMTAQPMSGPMPPMGMSGGYPQPGGMPGMPGMQPMTSAAMQSNAMPAYGSMPAFEPPPATKRRRLDLAVENRLVNMLYADFALQCGTCGLRFNDKEKMAKHLDWHFSVNKKEKQKSKKAISRLWFSTAEEWATGVDVAEKPVVPFFTESAAAGADDAQETRVMNVVADESQTHCGICGEKFDQFWDNDLEEWMYRGAVKVEGTGQLFHQKCYEQAVAMSQQQQQQQAATSSSSSSASTGDATTATDAAAAAAAGADGAEAAASSASLFWVKKEPTAAAAEAGEGGASRENRDTTSAEGSLASVFP